MCFLYMAFPVRLTDLFCIFPPRENARVFRPFRALFTRHLIGWRQTELVEHPPYRGWGVIYLSLSPKGTLILPQ